MNFNKKILLKMNKILKPNDSINDLLKELQLRLSQGQFNDSVHKIKLMVTKETVECLIHEN